MRVLQALPLSYCIGPAGDPRHSWTLTAIGPARTQAVGDTDAKDAIVAKTDAGLEQNWFIDVLGRNLAKITPVSIRSTWTTRDRILVSARILPSYMRAGGYDKVDARVEVEYPLVGLGRLLSKKTDRVLKFEGEAVSGAVTRLLKESIPTATITLPMNDDGVDGDQYPGNYYWTAALDKIPIVDGQYKLRYIFDFTADGCTTRREANQSIAVKVAVDPEKTPVKPDFVQLLPDLGWKADFVLNPVDSIGNWLGPGAGASLSCAPEGACKLESDRVIDIGDGSYRISAMIAPNTSTLRVGVWGTNFTFKVPCKGCPKVAGVVLNTRNATEHDALSGIVRLDRPAGDAYQGGTIVFLDSSDPRLVTVPDRVVIPKGKTEAAFEAKVTHLTDKQSRMVRIAARSGGEAFEASVVVVPHYDVAVPQGAPAAPGVRPDYPSRTRGGNQ